MHCIKAGHEYVLDHLDDIHHEILTFVNRGHGVDKGGTNNQEVLRVLIDRVKFLEEEMHWDGNEEIIQHLRMALVLHESRHLSRMVEKGKLTNPEELPVGDDGHFKLVKPIIIKEK